MYGEGLEGRGVGVQLADYEVKTAMGNGGTWSANDQRDKQFLPFQLFFKFFLTYFFPNTVIDASFQDNQNPGANTFVLDGYPMRSSKPEQFSPPKFLRFSIHKAVISAHTLSYKRGHYIEYKKHFQQLVEIALEAKKYKRRRRAER
ncbi:unnamed protein product, partial [Cylicostephanus goldi]